MAVTVKYSILPNGIPFEVHYVELNSFQMNLFLYIINTVLGYPAYVQLFPFIGYCLKPMC